MSDQLRALASQLYREVKNVESGFKLLNAHLHRPMAKETKTVIDDSIRALVFISSAILKDLERNCGN